MTTLFAFGEGILFCFFYRLHCGQEESMLHLGLGTQVFWDPKFSPQGCLAVWPECRCFSGTNGPFSCSLFAAVGFSLVAFSNSVHVPAMFPTIPRLDGTWHLPLLVTSVLWIELPWKWLTLSHPTGETLQPFASLICSKATECSKLAFQKSLELVPHKEC